jgi:hypothetical protein
MAVFELDLADFLNFRKMQKKNPKVFGAAASHVLNSAAFGVRKLAIRNIRTNMIARNDRFIEGSVRVRKARLSGSLGSKQSEVGSIRWERFTGWQEQEGGQQTKREHQAHPAARRGNIKKQIVRIARLKNVGRFPKPANFRGKNTISRALKMINVLSRSGFTKPFLLLGLGKWPRNRIPPGLYRFRGGKHPHRRIELLQRFKSPAPTKKKPWLSPAASQYIAQVDLRTVWGRAVSRELKKAGIKI